MTKTLKTILGIDPGTRITGYGIVSFDGFNFSALDYGCIRPPASLKLSDRYFIIYEGIAHLLEKHAIDALVVETQFASKANPQSGIKLGMARGAIIIAAKKYQIPIYEYPPTQVKLAAVGYGHASKHQVQAMIQNQFRLNQMPPPDAADALALTLCYMYSHKNKQAFSEL
ncbi:crossover junction endodeoxyribonuclease RuvC [Parachlamydia sp. AcF125]|uniref:crossover junction endodeoxyribonuclease RuvC n=1 Tax=Parachlamydia sp. AcF125 TaxID=2795736 RepID=UPI001BCA373C|nr:crossover junction endodeoxyribonuclease RuvC [Parachlamydia sp. AcF125]MBS4167608.1 Crossover junction endodeoxyribonuclease RuvC [Parachlamydia sp. AcF125]